MGHIELAAPVSHIWYFKGTPSRIGQVLEVSQKRLEEVLYFTKYIVVEPGSVDSSDLQKGMTLTEYEYQQKCETYGRDEFIAEMGAEAIQWLLDEYDPDTYTQYFLKYLTDVSRVIGMDPQTVREYLSRRKWFVQSGEQCGYPDGSEITYNEYKEMVLPYNRRCEDTPSETTPAVVKSGFAYICELFEAAFDPEDESLAHLRRENWVNDLQFLADQLKEELAGLEPAGTKSGTTQKVGQKQLKLLKRLEIVEAFLQSGNKPSWPHGHARRRPLCDLGPQ